MKKLLVIAVVGVSLMFGHGNHKHSHGHGFKHRHQHSSHNHHHNHSHGGHHQHWSNLIALHLAHDMIHHHNHKSSKYWKDKYMDVRTDLKLLWEDYNELERKYYDLLDEKLEMERAFDSLEGDRLERIE